MKKQAILFGALAGALIVLYSVIVFLLFSDWDKMTREQFGMIQVLGFLRYVILFLAVLFSIRYFKKQQPGGAGFGSLLRSGIVTALVVALFVGLMEGVYIALNPDFFNQYLHMMSRTGATTEEVDQYRREMDQMGFIQTPAGMGVFYFFETFLLGTLMSLILARIFRSRKPKAQVSV